MLPSHHKNILESYDSVVSRLSGIGIVVREVEGYSDREYAFIGAATVEEEKRGNSWLFTENCTLDFVRTAERFLLGYDMGKTSLPPINSSSIFLPYSGVMVHEK